MLCGMFLGTRLILDVLVVNYYIRAPSHSACLSHRPVNNCPSLFTAFRALRRWILHGYRGNILWQLLPLLCNSTEIPLDAHTRTGLTEGVPNIRAVNSIYLNFTNLFIDALAWRSADTVCKLFALDFGTLSQLISWAFPSRR